MTTLTDIARNFLQLAASGNARQAFKLYVAVGFKHHNAFYKGDSETLMLAMNESAMQNPDKIFQIQRTIEQGNLVAVHSRIQQNNTDSGAAVMHIFSFEGNKIIEMWDFAQPIPTNCPNENGMF